MPRLKIAAYLIFLPAIVLMSDKAEHFIQNVHKAGIAAIMPKPFFFSTFRQIVEELGTDRGGQGAGVETSVSNPLGSLRFLVAEDNAINADVLKELLEVEGARCEIAGNGKAAVAMFKNSRPGYYDMILMDIRMPLMDGYEATAEIRKLPREDAGLPILAIPSTSRCSIRQCTSSAPIDRRCTLPLIGGGAKRILSSGAHCFGQNTESSSSAPGGRRRAFLDVSPRRNLL